MNISEYISKLPPEPPISKVKEIILKRLWGNESDKFPKQWVSSEELLQLTEQKYFDRRVRELRDEYGCDIESSRRKEYKGYAWRIKSSELKTTNNRSYLTVSQKKELFKKHNYTCAICGKIAKPGILGLQADHKHPLSRGGSNNLENWQPICNNCNVGKRRACEGCQLSCKECSWAYPEKMGIPTIFRVKETTLRKIEYFCNNQSISKETFIEKAAENYLSSSTEQ